jgi:hypothetical protein
MYAWLHSFLPEFIQRSRKALLWFLALSADSILEGVKYYATVAHWTPQQIEWTTKEVILVQGVLTAAVALWTHQIAKEDAAWKMGLPPPAAAPESFPSTPPAPPRLVS